MNPINKNSSIAAKLASMAPLGIAAIFTTSTAFAADGTWTDITGGLWSDAGNWSGGTIANESGFNGNFNTLDITTDTTVNLDSARTLGSLTFGDTAEATAAGWILDNNGNAANILTLAGTTPTITVNALGTGKSANISAEIAGTQGVTLAGAGAVNLAGINTFTGGLNLNSTGFTTISGTNAAQTWTISGNAFNAGILLSNAGAIGSGSTLNITPTGTGSKGIQILDNTGTVGAGSSIVSTGSGRTNMALGTGNNLAANINVSGNSSNSLQLNIGTTAEISGDINLGATLLAVRPNFSTPLTGVSQNNSGTLTLSGDITGTATARIYGNSTGGGGSFTGTIVLSGNNTNFLGKIEAGGGTFSFGSAQNLGGAALWLGPSLEANTGNNRFLYTGSGGTITNSITLSSFAAGSNTLEQGGTGHVIFAGGVTTSGGSKALTLAGTTAGTGEISGIIANGAGTTAVTKTGTGTWTLSNAANTYSGGTNYNGGSLILGADNALGSGAITLNSTGSGSTAVTLDLNTYNQTASGFFVRNAATTVDNADTVTIGAGKALTVNGNVTIGSNVVDTTTFATISGLGSFLVGDGSVNRTFQVGGYTGGSNNGNLATLNMGGLTTFTANLGSGGTFRVGDASTGAGTGPSVATLAKTSSITTGVLEVGGSSGHGGLNLLKLGETSNTINANTISVGATTGRGNGEISFATGTGTLTVRNAAGSGAANLNVANMGNNGTGGNIAGFFDAAGHSADLLLGTLSIGNRELSASATGGGSTTGTFSFDTGTLAITSVKMGARSNVNNATALNATMNIGGGNVTIGSFTDMGRNNNATGTGTATSTLNISGGTVGIGSILNMAISGGSNGVVTSTVNITGGAVTMGGNITRFATSGSNANATLTLDGGSLNMGGFNIGGAGGAALNNVNFRSGTLSNLGQLNNGAALNKTTGGTLIMTGNNTYTGGTNVNGGILQAGSNTAFGSGAVNVNNGGTLEVKGRSLANAVSLVSGGTVKVDSDELGTGSVGTITATGGTFDSGTNASQNFNLNGSSTFNHLSGQGTFSGGMVSIVDSHNPGNSPGTQTFGSGLTYGDGASLTLEIAANGLSADLINVIGDLSIGNNVSLTLNLFGAENYTDSFWDDNRTFDLIITDTRSGNEFLTPLNNLGGGGQGTWTYGWDNNTYKANWTAVPEPTTALLGSIGVLFLLRRRRA